MADKSYFSSIAENQRNRYMQNAKNAVEHILAKEVINGGSFIFLDDRCGISGDVRDVVIQLAGKEIGISCKTNHGAFKHSRLSDKSNFIRTWGLNEAGCSKEYMETITPIFSQLRHIRVSSNKTAKWAEQEDVPNNYYWPVLNAFECEIRKHETPEMCVDFLKYIIGNQDFYKVISLKKSVTIQAFNLNKTLKMPVPQLPNKIDLIKSENGSQYAKTIAFNYGWTFNFRIHSASSRVEPSLKFDITAVSLSPKLYQHHIDL